MLQFSSHDGCSWYGRVANIVMLKMLVIRRRLIIITIVLVGTESINVRFRHSALNWKTLSTFKARTKQKLLQRCVVPDGLAATLNEFVHVSFHYKFPLVQVPQVFVPLPK